MYYLESKKILISRETECTRETQWTTNKVREATKHVLRVWDVRTHLLLNEITETSLFTLNSLFMFSDYGNLIAIRNLGSLSFYFIESGKLFKLIPCPEKIDRIISILTLKSQNCFITSKDPTSFRSIEFPKLHKSGIIWNVDLGSRVKSLLGDKINSKTPPIPIEYGKKLLFYWELQKYHYLGYFNSRIENSSWA